jgi:hypothetical protein
MAPIVGAAGSLLGGLAAKAAGADKGKGPTNGGGIPGLTSSKGQGKDGTGPGYATQVDSAPAISYFKQAAEAQSSGYNQGLSYYGTALDKASQSIKEGYTAANNTLQPLSYSSGQALNQQMRMLGLDPIQATMGFSDSLKTGYGAVKDALPQAASYVNSIASQMDAASALRDPRARAEAVANLKSAIETGNAGIISGIQNQINAIATPKNQIPQQYAAGQILDNGAGARMTMDVNDANRANAYTYDNATTANAAALAAYNAKIDPLKAQLETAKKYTQGLSDFGNNFAQNYGAEYDRGYTPEEIGNVVSNLPGYQFNLDQGTKAIERQGAARGMLGSGNTLDSLQKYGQGQATSYYNQYMGYLSGITAQGAPATAQISANQSAEGTALGTLAQNYGMAQMQTSRANADFLAKTLQDSGILFNQNAQFNAAAQNASISQYKQQQGQIAQQAIQSGPSYMNAQTQQGQLGLAQQIQGWNQQQGQQQAQALAGGSSGGYSAGGLRFTDYTGAGWI